MIFINNIKNYLCRFTCESQQKFDIDFIVSCNEYLAEHTIINDTIQLLFKYGHECGHELKKLSYLLES